MSIHGLSSFLKRVPLGGWVVFAVALGFILGSWMPQNPVMKVLGTSGTYFPKTGVTFATAIIFFLLAAATARLILGSVCKL